MTRQSRLRVQKKRKNRRLLVFFGLLLVFIYQCEHQYDISGQLRGMVSSAQKKFAENALDRGTIYDRNLKQLAVTMERVAVFVRTREVDSIPDTATALASILSLDRDKLRGQLESGVLRLWVAEDINQEQEQAIKNLDLPGVLLQKEEKRYYPNGKQAAHLIGYVEDGIGLSGVEFYYDRLLATRKVQQQEQNKPLSNTQDLVLTIDLKIQKIVEELVARIAENEKAVKVAAYIIESGTGELIAGAQHPGFDPNSFTRYTRRAMENIFFSASFLPDAFRVFLRDSAMLYEQEDSSQAPLPWSLRENASSLGGQVRLWDWLKLGEKAQTDFFATKTSPGAARKKMSRVGLDDVSFGLVPEMTTPISLLAAYSTLLNGKSQRSPFVVKKVLDIETREEVLLNQPGEKTETEESFGGEPLGQVRNLFQSMATRENSSSYFFRDQVLLSTEVKGGENLFTLCDFTFVTIPADDHELNMLVVVQRDPATVEPKSSNRLRIEEILDERVDRISVLQQISATVADVVEPEQIQSGNFPVRIVRKADHKPDKDKPEMVSIAGSMPDVVGLSLRKSLRLLEGAPIIINIEGTGRVLKQEPAPGTPLKEDMVCLLTLERYEDMKLEKFSAKKKQ